MESQKNTPGFLILLTPNPQEVHRTKGGTHRRTANTNLENPNGRLAPTLVS